MIAVVAQHDNAPRFDGGLGWVSAGSGRIDLTGKPLGEALYTRVALEQAEGPFLAVRPVNHTGDKHSPSAWMNQLKRIVVKCKPEKMNADLAHQLDELRINLENVLNN